MLKRLIASLATLALATSTYAQTPGTIVIPPAGGAITYGANVITALGFAANTVGGFQVVQNRAANLIFAGPTSGSPTIPTFRSIVGADLWPVFPGASANVESTGTPGIDGGEFFIWNAPSTWTPLASLRVDRHMSGATPSGGGAVSSGLWVNGSNNWQDGNDEWNSLSQFNNFASATFTSSFGAQNVAHASAMFKKRSPAGAVATSTASGNGTTATVTFASSEVFLVGSTVLIAGVTPSGYNGKQVVTASSAGSVSFSSTTTGSQTVAGTIYDITVSTSWGENDYCEDDTGENNPIVSCVGDEIDISIQNPDGVATTDNNRQRVGLQIAASSNVGSGGPTHVGRAIVVAPDGNTVIDRILDVGAGDYLYGLDFSLGTFQGPAINLAQGQSIAFDFNAGSYNRTLSYQSGTLVYHTQNGNVIEFDDAGDIISVGVIEPALYTVSTLPTGKSTGSRATVSDAVTCTLNGALTGGGSTVCPVHYSGASWVGG